MHSTSSSAASFFFAEFSPIAVGMGRAPLRQDLDAEASPASAERATPHLSPSWRRPGRILRRFCRSIGVSPAEEIAKQRGARTARSTKPETASFRLP
jgi:hypothetical protein